MSEILQVLKLNTNAKLPTRAHPGDAGIDLYSLTDGILVPNAPIKIQTGIAMSIPHGFAGMICDRSSMGAKGIRVLGGIVDSEYRGEVQVLLINLGTAELAIKKGDKIAQMLVLPVNLCTVSEVSSLSDTARSDSGFGSSGR